MRLSPFHALGANGDALLVEIDFRPQQALRFLASKRNEQQETDQGADVTRRVLDRGPCAANGRYRWRVIARTSWTRPVVTIDGGAGIDWNQLALRAPGQELLELAEHMVTLKLGAIDRVDHQANGARIDVGDGEAVASHDAKRLADVMDALAPCAIGEVHARAEGLSVKAAASPAVVGMIER